MTTTTITMAQPPPSVTTVLLHGVAGSGKSALVQAQPWQERGWLLASGKFSQHDAPTLLREPFTALIEAMNELVEQWLQQQQQQHNDNTKAVVVPQLIDDFRTLLEEDVEFLRHLIPQVYQAVKVKGIQCCNDYTGRKKQQQQQTNEVVAMTTLVEEKAREDEEVSVHPHDAFPKLHSQPSDSIVTIPNNNESSDQDTRRLDHYYRSDRFSMKQDAGTIDCVNVSFVRMFSFLCRTQPVVLYLHNVHLADAASLKVIELLATSQSSNQDNKDDNNNQREDGPGTNLLLMLTYRDDEVMNDDDIDSEHFLATIDRIKQYEAKRVADVVAEIATMDVETNSRTETNTKNTIQEYDNARDENEGQQDETKQESSFSEKIQDNTQQQQEKESDNLKGQARPQRIHDIEVKNLNVESVNNLVASLTKRSPDETLRLAQVIHRKTAGNPFFVVQFLQMLRQEEFIRYSYMSLQFEWGDVDKLESAALVSDNVADVVAATMERLPEATRIALVVAACLGKIIPLHVLVEWFDSFDESQAGMTCSTGLHHIQQQGLHTVLDNAVKVAILIRPKGHDAYMWAHDKLQNVAYSLIPHAKRAKCHLKLGRLLWKMSKEYPQEEWMVFMAAEQMNRYSQYSKQQDKTTKTMTGNDDDDTEAMGSEVATLCLEAARLSLAKSALYPAYDMLQAGVKHLNVPHKWENHYDLCLSLYSTVAEMSVQLGKQDEASRAVDEVERHARFAEDKFRVQMVHLKVITSGDDRNYELGMELGMDILKTYGVRMPTKLIPGMLMMECNKLRRRLPGGKLEGILELRIMSDVKSRHIMILLSYIGMFALMTPKTNKNLGWYFAVRGLNLSMDKGVTEETAMAIVILGGAHRQQGNYKDANECGELGLKLLDRFPQTVGSLHAAVMGMVLGGIFCTTRPLNKCLDLWLEAHHVGLRTGRTEKAGGAILAYALTYITCGLPLGPLLSDLYQYEKEVIQFNLPGTVLAVFKILQQFILNLQDERVLDPVRLKGKAMDANELLSSFHGNALTMTERDVNTFRLMLATIYGDMDAAERLIGKLEPFLESDVFYVRSSIRRSTVALAAFKISRTNGKRRLLLLARKLMKEYRDVLKKGNVNALPLYTMLEAEESPSKERYDHAIRMCARLGLLHFEAYMCEQAGLYFLEENKDEDWAEFYLAQAFCLNEDWGARAKAQKLKRDHPRLLRSSDSSMRERANSALKGRTRYSSSHADLLKDFDWERLSSSTISSSGSSSSISGTSTSRSGGLLSPSSSGSSLADMVSGKDFVEDGTSSITDETNSEAGSTSRSSSPTPGRTSRFRRRPSTGGGFSMGDLLGLFSSPLYS